MKTNAPKRKMFQDAVDLVSPPETINSLNGSQTMISVENIVPFHNHPFRLYEGNRLDDMVESIREHGILIPVIVQKIANGYEMLSGHNRWNAAKIVGIKEIPATVKENLTEREAYVYVIETNMLKRSLDDLLPSEKAAVLAERYEKVMCQGRRNDILEEIAMLNGMDAPETCGHDVHRFPHPVPWGDLQHSFRRPHELQKEIYEIPM
jgi:ParB family chromosome partitioning protein